MKNRVLVLETIKVLRTVYNTASHKHRGLGLNLGVDSGGRIGAGGGEGEATGARDTIFSCVSSSTVN